HRETRSSLSKAANAASARSSTSESSALPASASTAHRRCFEPTSGLHRPDRSVVSVTRSQNNARFGRPDCTCLPICMRFPPRSAPTASMIYPLSLENALLFLGLTLILVHGFALWQGDAVRSG